MVFFGSARFGEGSVFYARAVRLAERVRGVATALGPTQLCVDAVFNVQQGRSGLLSPKPKRLHRAMARLW
jgi:hypothetical protein